MYQLKEIKKITDRKKADLSLAGKSMLFGLLVNKYLPPSC